MKICGYCGRKCDDNSKFCIHCGAPLQTQDGSRQRAGNENAGRSAGGNSTGGSSGYRNTGASGPQEEIIYTDVVPRSTALSVILTIVTCGIYGLYWIYKLNDEVNEMAQDERAPGGGLVVILFLLSCGLFGLYWFYKMGEKCDYIAQTRSSNNIVFLLLSAIGLGIVALALIQETVNRALE